MEDNFEEQYMPTSSSYTLNEEKYLIQSHKRNTSNNVNYRLLHPGIPKIPGAAIFKNYTKNVNSTVDEDFQWNDCDECNDESVDIEPYCYVKYGSILKLKNSTKKLLYLLDEIQSKTYAKSEFVTLEDFGKSKSLLTNSTKDSDLINLQALKKLETHTKYLDGIYIKDQDDDCSVYKRLTRQCHCLNEMQYNDFMIHFNQETKYSTSNIGEIVKNMKILKKFLYMGGDYTKHALMFIYEGLTQSHLTEKIEITLGCTHADICNIFDDYSLVITCISWPCKHCYFGDTTTQNLASKLLLKLAAIEEGRRYLNFSTKITNDIRKVLRKKSTFLEIDTLDALNETLNLLKPPFNKNFNAIYLNKSIYEGFGFKTVNDLLKVRHYMTLDEIFTHLDLLKNFTKIDTGKSELTTHLRSLLILFKNMLLEFNNSQMNILIMQILNNIVSRNIGSTSEHDQSNVIGIADAATEPIKMLNQINQMPSQKKIIRKKPRKCKLKLGVAPNKNRQPSLRKVSVWEQPTLCRSSKFSKDLRRSVIIVPIEKN